MAKSNPHPLSRSLAVNEIPPGGMDVTVVTTADERAALARDFGLPAVPELVGRYHLSPVQRGVTVTGTVEGVVTQRCVVSLELFDSPVHENVEAAFSEDAPVFTGLDEGEDEDGEGRHELTARDLDAPDPIVNGRIDLGALTAEFLALGLDPYPRKPGAAFEAGPEPERDSPFAALKSLKDGEEP
jgi:uncharacterized metal-binding protein YceD (DUF177 family)